MEQSTRRARTFFLKNIDFFSDIEYPNVQSSKECIFINTCDKIIDLFHLWVNFDTWWGICFDGNADSSINPCPWFRDTLLDNADIIVGNFQRDLDRKSVYHTLIITMCHIIRQCWHIIRHFSKRFGQKRTTWRATPINPQPSTLKINVTPLWPPPMNPLFTSHNFESAGLATLLVTLDNQWRIKR